MSQISQGIVTSQIHISVELSSLPIFASAQPHIILHTYEVGKHKAVGLIAKEAFLLWKTGILLNPLK